MSRQVVSVQLLTSYIRQVLETDDVLADLWVEGEIAETFVARSGHVYFTLHDDQSRLKCVIFKAQAQRLRALPRSGDQIAAHGRISVYERDGTYQLYVDFLQPAGLGILALQLELLRQQLAAEGLFEPTRKRPIPPMPSCIGVVTSVDGAVWHDIQHVLRRRYPLALLLLASTPVQGDAAPAGIVAALKALQDDGRPEVIIIARGGGSAEDLWCFQRRARRPRRLCLPYPRRHRCRTRNGLDPDRRGCRSPGPYPISRRRTLLPIDRRSRRPDRRFSTPHKPAYP